MTSEKALRDELCMPYDEACSQFQDAADAIAFVEGQLKTLSEIGYPTVEIETKIKSMKRKLAVLKRKWDL